MTDKKTSTPAREPRRPPHDCDYVRRYSDEVHLAAGTGTEVENESVVVYVAFRHDWMRRHALRAQMCSLVDVTGDSMKWSALHFMLNGKRTVMESWSAPALRIRPAGPESLTISSNYSGKLSTARPARAI